ncbi:hypothetical protein T4D_16613 [Trichinella pseudospiralis]|uniref:Uncharacterized protein n=1 Tax=Trichinella pseudospiralis TaxID=6337 RepID=A0A0V1F8F1_TRIPS|nr:hypothetical protein T4D_16613 [Trichinella pseudospiralis]
MDNDRPGRHGQFDPHLIHSYPVLLKIVKTKIQLRQIKAAYLILYMYSKWVSQFMNCAFIKLLSLLMHIVCYGNDLLQSAHGQAQNKS